MSSQRVEHPQLGPGRLIKTYMGGHEWEVEFASGRRFRLPAREFEISSIEAVEERAPAALVAVPADHLAVLSEEEFRARQTLEALRFGIVPMQDVETLTIGLEAERISLERALARAKEHGGDVMAVIGDYGFGKSHFVEMAARRALRENFIVMTASLDLVEVPPAKPREIYRALAASTRYPDTQAHGLRHLLEAAIEFPNLVERFAELSSLGEADPLIGVLHALEACTTQSGRTDLIEWISGEINPTREMRVWYKRPPSLYKTGEVARQYTYLLSGLGTLAVVLGYSGIAVLIDESEHYSLLRARQRERADSAFQALIYAAVGSNNGRIDPDAIPHHARANYPVAFTDEPHLFFLFALTESENRMPVDEWLAPSQIVRLDDRFIERDIQKFFVTLRDYHVLAYDDERINGQTAHLVESAPGLLSRMLSQHRINLRELIRTAVTLYDLLYLHDDYSSEAALNELADGLGL
jgi:hypothetical protein